MKPDEVVCVEYNEGMYLLSHCRFICHKLSNYKGFLNLQNPSDIMSLDC